jgi:3'-5' exoribonuclease
VELMTWPIKDGSRDEVTHAKAILKPGAIVVVHAEVEVDKKHGTRLVARARDAPVSMRLAIEGEYRVDVLVQCPARPLRDLEQDLSELVDAIQSNWLHRLAHGFFKAIPSPFYAAFRDAPAAKGVHQAYRHGLIEHTVGVAQTVYSVARSGALGAMDADLALTGALLHDVGKVHVYTRDIATATEMTSRGRLHGEIPLSYFMVQSAIIDLPGFPVKLADEMLHIVNSHHGQLEWGSPILPMTREATLVHAVDRLAAQLGIFDRLEETLPAGEEWTGYDRALGTQAWFPRQ